MALISDARVPRICHPPTPGESSGTASDFRFNAVDCIPCLHPLIHGRRSNDVSRFALLGVVRSACTVACAAQQPEPALTMRCVQTVTEWACRVVGMASRRPTRVCFARLTKLYYGVMCFLGLHPAARLPDTIISTNEPSPTPSDTAGGTARMLKHSPGPPFRVAAGCCCR